MPDGLSPAGQAAVACGWPSQGVLSSKQGRVIGQCWHPSASADGTTEIFVSPILLDAVPVLAMLVHDLVHAAVGIITGQNVSQNHR